MPMTLRCAEPSGNGAEGTRSQWGTAGSAEEPSPEAARLAKALRELSHTGRARAAAARAGGGASPRQGWGLCRRGAQPGGGDELGKQRMRWRNGPLLPVPASERDHGEDGCLGM